jgi:hypothetical protein
MIHFENVLLTTLEEQYIAYQKGNKIIFLPKTIQAPSQLIRTPFFPNRNQNFIFLLKGEIFKDYQTLDVFFLQQQVLKYYHNYNINEKDLEEFSYIFHKYIPESLQMDTLSKISFQKKEIAIRFFCQKLKYLYSNSLSVLHQFIQNDSPEEQIIIIKKFLNTKSNQIKLHLPSISSFLKHSYSLEQLQPILSINKLLTSDIMDEEISIASFSDKQSILFFDISLEQESLFPLQLQEGSQYLEKFMQELAHYYQVSMSYDVTNKKNKFSIHFYNHNSKETTMNIQDILQMTNQFLNQVKKNKSFFFQENQISTKKINIWIQKNILAYSLNSAKIEKKNLKI